MICRHKCNITKSHIKCLVNTILQFTSYVIQCQKMTNLVQKSMIWKTYINKYHQVSQKSYDKLLHMICRLNDHYNKMFGHHNTIKKYHKDTKWHDKYEWYIRTNYNNSYTYIACCKSLSHLWDVFTFFYHKIKNNTWHKIA